MNRLFYHYTLRYILIVIACLGILDTICIVMIGGGVNFGTLFPGLMGGAVLLWLYIREWILRKAASPFIRWMSAIIKTGFILWLISFLCIVGLIYFSASSDTEVKADYLLVLGAGLRGDQVSLTLKERLDMAVDYLERNPDTRVVVSGGQGPGETITEAEAMRRYLVARNIDEGRILMEDKATSTMENLKYTGEILKNLQKDRPIRFVVITSDFHLFRTQFLARRNGFEAYGIGATTPWYLVPNCYIREYLAVIKSWLLDWP